MIPDLDRRKLDGTGAADPHADALLDRVDSLIASSNRGDWTETTDTLDVYLDGASGKDNNSGLSEGSPVKTWARVLQLIPHAITNQTVTVHFLGALYDCKINGPIDLTSRAVTGNGLLVLAGDWTQLATGTVTDEDPGSDNWGFQDTGASFDSSYVGATVVFTSGWANGYHYTITEVISATTVRFDRPARRDVGGAQAGAWADGDTYTACKLDTLIRDTDNGNEAAVYNALLNDGNTLTDGSPLRIRLEKLAVQGGTKGTVMIADSYVDLTDVLVHESANWTGGLILDRIRMHTENVVALPKVTGTSKYGVWILTAEGRYSRLDSDNSTEFRKFSLSCVDMATGLSIRHATRLPSISVQNGYIMGLWQCFNDTGIIAMRGGGYIDVVNGYNLLPESLRLIGSYLQITAAEVDLWLSGSARSAVIDGSSSVTNGIRIRRGSTLRYRQTTSDATKLTIKANTGAGIKMDDASRLCIDLGTLLVDDCNIGVEADNAFFGHDDGLLETSNHASDGIKCTNCFGGIKCNSHDNGGYGLQALKASMLNDRGSTFADNTSGDTNVDADSKWV